MSAAAEQVARYNALAELAQLRASSIEVPESVSAADICAEQIEWLWRKRIPRGMFSLIAGQPGRGKSLLVAHLLADVTRAGGNVILSNVEDHPARVLRPRLEAAGAILGRIHLWTPTLPRDTSELAALVLAKRARLVVLDPISSHLRSRIYNDQDVRTALAPLIRVAAVTGCAFLGIHHMLKNSSGGLAALGGASGGLPGVARAVFVFGTHPHDPDERVLAPIKTNVPVPPEALVFDHETTRQSERLCLVGEELVNVHSVSTGSVDTAPDTQTEIASVAEWLTLLIANSGPLPSAEVKRRAVEEYISRRTVRLVARGLGIATRAGLWRLPKNHPLAA